MFPVCLILLLLLFYKGEKSVIAKSINGVTEPASLEPLFVIFQNKCIEDLGCFYTGPPFYHPLYRPISLAPTSELKTKFLLYTPLNSNKAQALNLTQESVGNSSFVAKLPTKILIHGYSVKLEEDDVRFKLKDELLREGDYNVIIVNWTEHNGFPYSQAVANARVIGAQGAKLVNLLMTEKYITPRSVHLIGHSLGGQIAGYIGERIQNVGRITGLDPAGPFFHNAAKEVRLDPTDADFVDVIHSNGGDNAIEGLGLIETVGHMDFFPNGGKSQPGCTYDSTDEPPKEDLVANSCDHSRANYLFLESISECTFWARQCNSYVSFESGECNKPDNIVSKMGFHAEKIHNLRNSTKFYLKTTDQPPYCVNHYTLTSHI